MLEDYSGPVLYEAVDAHEGRRLPLSLTDLTRVLRVFQPAGRIRVSNAVTALFDQGYLVARGDPSLSGADELSITEVKQLAVAKVKEESGTPDGIATRFDVWLRKRVNGFRTMVQDALDADNGGVLIGGASAHIALLARHELFERIHRARNLVIEARATGQVMRISDAEALFDRCILCTGELRVPFEDVAEVLSRSTIGTPVLLTIRELDAHRDCLVEEARATIHDVFAQRPDGRATIIMQPRYGMPSQTFVTVHGDVHGALQTGNESSANITHSAGTAADLCTALRDLQAQLQGGALSDAAAGIARRAEIVASAGAWDEGKIEGVLQSLSLLMDSVPTVPSGWASVVAAAARLNINLKP